MDVRVIDLPWLAEPPSDFRQQVRELWKVAPAALMLARRLSTYRSDSNQMYALGKVIDRLAQDDAAALRLGVLSNGTTELLTPALSVGALRHGVCLQSVTSAFDQVATEALDSASRINQARCQFVLLAVDHRGLPLVQSPGDEARARESVGEALRYVDSLCRGLRDASGCTVICQTVPQVVGAPFGSLERNLPGTLQWLVDCFNRELRLQVRGSSDLLLDAAGLAETVGLTQWHDPVQWALGKFPFSHAVVPLYADWVGRLIAAARGRSRKCLVLDLDNTLWGGVVGDDGVEGLVLGNGSPVGEAYLQVQRTALTLRERGIILAVSSKNDEQIALGAFRSHPEMLLKAEHIAVFQLNWLDKAANLRAIAEKLNLGVDALVLLDDNPVERAQVRAALPGVAVPELPTDPAFYAGILMNAGYFEAVTFTAEDRIRADSYRANAARAASLEVSTDLESHLLSLKMQMICAPFDRIGRSRITQLINKTNQFNLTTRRYTESEVEAFEVVDEHMTAQIRLVDRFGDNGMIAVIICIPEGPDWHIDTWLMSCRVLNRKVEAATLNYLVGRAKAAGVRSLIGEYLRTERNGIVAEHYDRLGFERVSVDASGSRWRLDVCSYVPIVVPIQFMESNCAANLNDPSAPV
jgi:FkbH-like protein